MKLSQNLLLCLLVLGYVSSQAQDKPNPEPTKGTLAEEIEVVRPYKPVLANAAKIRRNPDLTDVKAFKPNLNYSILDKKLTLNSDIKQLQYQTLAPQKATELSSNYLKLGAGTLKTGLAELYINTNRDEALQAGIYARHFSEQGTLLKQQFSTQELAIFGKTIGTKTTLSGNAAFKRLGTYFYGSDPLALLTTNPEKQRLQDLHLQGELLSRYTPNSTQWNYGLSLGTHLFNNAAQGKESQIILHALASKKVKAFTFGLNTRIDLGSSKNQTFSISNNLVKANPFAAYTKDDFTLRVGLNLVQEFGTTARLNTLPAIDLSAPLAGKQVVFIAGISGDVNKTTLNEQSFINPFLSETILIKNSITKSEAFVGIKGNLGPNVGFNARGYFKEVDQLPLFINNSSDARKFDLIYDNGVSKISGMELALHIKASDIFNLESSLKTAQYKLATEAKAWFKPSVSLQTAIKAQVSKKTLLSASIEYQGATAGKIGSTAVPIPSFFNAGAGANYTLNKKWAIYLQANNLLGKEFQQYLYYPNLGRQFFGGIHYSFWGLFGHSLIKA